MNDEDVRLSIQRGHCPDCKKRGFILGPKGGASQMIKCANLECEAIFTVVSRSWDILLAERCPRD